MYTSKAMIESHTAEQLVGIYIRTIEMISDGYGLLHEAEEIIEGAMGAYNSHGSYNVLPEHYSFRYTAPSEYIKRVDKRIRIGMWMLIIEKLGIKKMASVSRYKELTDKIYSNPPELTEQAIFDMLETFLQNQNTILQELVDEVFDWLRPYSNYKTNKKWKVGKKVIKGWVIEHQYNGDFRLNYRREANVVAMERLFYLLDEKSYPKEPHKGFLGDAIAASGEEGKGETDYFKFQCYKNGNIHITFKRLDLVARLNQLAGSGDLPGKADE